MSYRILTRRALAIAGVVLLASTASTVLAEDPPKVLRAGMIGLDTSHAVAFAELLNGKDETGQFGGVRVVAAYPGGSPDLPSSWDRVEGYTKDLRDKFGVEIVDSIPALLEKVDVVFLESVDGRPHLEQVRLVIAAGKPVFIDKPVAASLADTIEIYQLAGEAGVPCFSSSSLRFSPNYLRFRGNEDPESGKVIGASTHGPCVLEEHHPDLFWYGIHGVETLYTILGPGCQSVTRSTSPGTDVVVGLWGDGRIGTFRGLRDGRSDFGATIFGEKQILATTGYDGYKPLVVEICKFFRTGQPPVAAQETIELVAFMEAADESKRRGGAPVSIAEQMEQAQKELAARSAAADKKN
jgi:predicted dehydrogenase